MPTPTATPIVDGQKVCTRCLGEKPLDQFGMKHKDRARTRSHWCRDCTSTYMREYWEKRGGRTARHAASVKRLYGLSIETYHAMLLKQGGVCAICIQPPTDRGRWNRLCVDHCHATKRVRGLLCGKCNAAIGAFDENPHVLAAAIAYLKRYKGSEN